MPQSPSIYETGRVGPMGVTESGVEIKQTPTRARPQELRVEGATPKDTTHAAPPPGGILNRSVLGTELRPRLALLKDCRVEVARQKRTAAAAITAGRVTLRWTVLPSTGHVTNTEVVAHSPVDGHVIDCMKRQMSVWKFTPPTGGPAAVERPFRFQ